MPVEDESQMSVETIHVVYDGAPMANGAMDVRDLAPALLSIGELCQEVNRQVYGTDTVISVRVKADFQKGSFGVDLEVVKTFLEQARSLLSNVDPKSAQTLIEIVFGGGGILAILKWLRGRKDPATTNLENGNIRIEIKGDGNNHIVVKSQVYKLANDPAIRKYVDGAIRQLKNPGMTKMEVKQSNRTIQTVEKGEVPYLSVDHEDETQALQTEGRHEAVRVAYLEIIKLSFKPGNKWSFSDGSGGLLSVSIEDQEFQDKVDRHEYSFGNGDQLKVSLKTVTTRLPSGKYQAAHAIVKVLEVIQSPQTDMFKNR